jgi:hypothetical protein
MRSQHPVHPKIGVEYEATEDTDAVDAGASYVPIEWDDTGNLVVAHYDESEGFEEIGESGDDPHYDEHRDDGKRIPWNGDTFVEHVQDGQLVERNTQ